MKAIATAALALSMIATATLADDNERQAPEHAQPAPSRPSRSEAARPPADARPPRSEGAGAPRREPQQREAPRPQIQAAPATPAPQVVAVPAAAPPQPRERGEFRGRRGDVPGATEQRPEPRTFQSDGGRRRRDEVQAEQQVSPPPPRAPSVQTAPSPRAPVVQSGATAPRAQGQQQGGWTRDGDRNRDGRRDGSRESGATTPRTEAQQQGGWRDGDRNRDGRRDGDGSRNWDGRRGGDQDRDGWNRDGGRGGWDRDGHGPQVRPDWATRDGRHDRDRNRPQYDPRRYRHDWRADHRYSIGVYFAPFGYYDRYWNYDEFLPWGWYGPRYWIDDWFRYGLPPPPAGYEWVRVGNDAVLVDIFDGRVRSVVRLLFW